jgi:hypothetical protein
MNYEPQIELLSVHCFLISWFILGSLNTFLSYVAYKEKTAKAQGGRPVGRPRQTWEEQMSIVMPGRGINWREARIVAQDRSRWRRLWRSLDTAR